MKKPLAIAFFLLTFISHSSIAGSRQNEDSAFSTDELKTFAKKVENYAANEGAYAFIIARLGRPEKELPKGIRFTHTAIAIYSTITLDSGEMVKGYAIHNLYQTENQPDKSELVMDYPVDFFWGASTLKAGIIIPTDDLQQRIQEVIANGGHKLVHNENYSVIANPFNNQFQNCTEHTLNVVNAGIYQTSDMVQLKSNTEQYFKPQSINASPFKLLLGNLFVDEVSTKDHSGKIYTTTFTSIGRYLQTNELVNKAIILNDDGSVSELL